MEFRFIYPATVLKSWLDINKSSKYGQSRNINSCPLHLLFPMTGNGTTIQEFRQLTHDSQTFLMFLSSNASSWPSLCFFVIQVIINISDSYPYCSSGECFDFHCLPFWISLEWKTRSKLYHWNDMNDLLRRQNSSTLLKPGHKVILFWLPARWAH